MNDPTMGASPLANQSSPAPASPLDQLIANEASGAPTAPTPPAASTANYHTGVPAPANSVVQGSPASDALDELMRHEQDDQHGLQQIQGEAAAVREQEGYNAQIVAQSQPQQTTASTPVTSGTADNLKQTAADVGHRIVDIGKGAVAGVVNAAGELASSVTGLLAQSFDSSWQYREILNSKWAQTNPEVKAFAEQQLALNQKVTNTVTNAPRALAGAIAPSVDTIGGELTEGLTQFTSAFVLALRGQPEDLPLAARALYATVAGGATQAAAFNPNDPRLSNLIQKFPALKNPVTDFLASNPGDNEAVGRLKNFIEGTVLSGAGEGVTEAFSKILTGMRASGAIADTVKAVQDAKPTEILAATPAVEPAVQPELTQGAPAGTVQASTPAPAWSPDAKPWQPAALKDVDTAHPRAASEGAPAVEPAATTSGEAAPAARPTFDPEQAAQAFMSVPAEKVEVVRQAIVDGKYADVPGLLDQTHNTIPWDTLSDGANLKGTFAAVEQSIGDVIRDAHGVAPVSRDAVVQLAKDIGGDVSSVPRLMADTTDNGGLAARITAGYNIMTASARRLQTLGLRVGDLDVTSDAGKAAVLDFEKQLSLHAAIVGQVRRSSSEIGRALWAHRELKASSEVALRGITELTNTTLGPNAIKTFAEKLGTSTNLADINKAADQLRGKGFVAVIKEIAQNGMLSGPTTQLANISGNVVNGLIKPAERYLAGVIGQVRGVFMPNAEVATIRSAIAHTTGIVGGLRDSFPLFVKALTSEQSVSASGRVLTRAIYKDTAGLTGADLTVAQVINRVGQIVRYPGRFMGAIDNLNMGIGRQADLQARTYLMAAKEADANGLAGDARDSFMTKRMQELRANPPADVRAKSIDAGLYQSFQEAAKTRFGEGVSNLLNSHPLVKLLVAPFVHRPLNMLRQSLMDYTLLGGLSTKTWETLKAANADTDVAIARMMLGTSALIYGVHLAGSGSLTGERLGGNNTQNLDGIPRDAIKIGNTWHQFNRLDPVGTWLAVSADLHEALSRAYDPNNADHVEQFGKAFRSAIQVVGAAAMDKSFMQSTQSVMEWLSSRDPKRSDVLGQRLLESNVFKFLPFSGALRAAARANDTTERASGGDGLAHIWDSIKANLPVLSQELAPKRDILGRPIAYPGGTSAWWNPFAGTTAATDTMDQELSKLAVNVREPPRTLQGITMTPEAYDEVLTRSTQSPIFPGNQNLEGYLREMVNSDTWKSFDSTDDHGVMAHTKMVQDAIDAAYNYGKNDYMQAHPDFLQVMQQRAEQQALHFQWR